MKTFLPLKQDFVTPMLLVVMTISVVLAQGQTSKELIFNGHSIESGVDKQVDVVYRFNNVTTNTDALVTLDSLVNGAQLSDVDETNTGLGYNSAFQPRIAIPAGTGISYAVFTVKFVKSGTSSSVTLPEVGATALDIDGNATLKEFNDIDMNGGTMSYMSLTPQISVTNLLTGFRGINLLGVELTGIDTLAQTNMFSITNQNISQLKLRSGSVYVAGGATTRQHSFFMKSFTYKAITLPVKLVSFSAMLIDNKGAIKWTTASEMNVSHFEVEKSFDGKNYNSAGVVFAYGNTNEKMNYSFSDNINASQSGVIYYRLRSVDIDGKSQYSDTRIIRISKQTENAITVVTYPNPVSNELRVTIPNNWQNKKVTYEVFNSNGQVSKKSETANSSQTENISVSSLAPGFYIVKVNCDGQSVQQKIIKK